MKNYVLRNYLYRVVAIVALALAQRGIAEAQTIPSQSTVSGISSVGGDNLIATKMPSSSSSADALPDAPMAQDQSSGQNQQAAHEHQTQINPIPLLSPGLVAGTALTTHDKWEIYYHKTYSPAAMIFPLFGAGISMANPKKNYPEEWQDGVGAFGRIYGNAIAERSARSTAEFGTQVLFHEDSRYERSGSTNPLLRVGHALMWTLVDKSDSGHRTFALSSFAGSAAGGFVGMAYLPDGYNDVTHAEQRTAMGIGIRASSNVLAEFQSVWGPWAAKVHIPKLLPDWWTPKSKP
jgi:hypothetical protein